MENHATIKANEITIRNLDKLGKNIIIPRYQRPFDWNGKHIEQLFDDIGKSIFDHYYIGTITIHEKSRDIINLLDGQQRLTTIIIILLEIYYHYGKTVGKDLKKTIKSIIWINKNKRIGINDYIIESIRSNEKMTNKNSHYQRVINGTIKKIKKKISEVENINDFVNKVLNIIFVKIVIGNAMNPYVVFNNLNNKGKILSYRDKVKNILFSSGEGNSPDKIELAWQELEKSIDSFNTTETNITEKALVFYNDAYNNENKKKFLKRLESEYTIFKTKEQLEEKNKKEYSKAIKAIKNYRKFADSLKHTYDNNVKLDFIKNNDQRKRINMLLSMVNQKKKFKQIKPILAKSITIFKKNISQYQTFIKILYFSLLIQIFYEFTNTKGNLFENQVKKNMSDNNTLNKISKLLLKFIHKNFMDPRKLKDYTVLDGVLEAIFTPKFSGPGSQYFKNNRKIIILSNQLYKGCLDQEYDQFNWEHPLQQKTLKTKNNFFLLEKELNDQAGKIYSKKYSKIKENKEIIKIYHNSKLNFPKKITQIRASINYVNKEKELIRKQIIENTK